MRSSLRLLLVLSLVCWSHQQDAEQPAPMTACNERPRVETTQGPICGVDCPDGPVEVCGKPDDGFTPRNYMAFAGIPFAKPPVRDLRFKSPAKPEAWPMTRDGGWMPPMCPQLDIFLMFQGNLTVVGEEDCLYLNVYVPQVDIPEGGFPVMVWIHGGGFIFDGVQEYYADKLMTQDVILVSIQYRLGILGWLSTGDDAAPGNLALKDQEMALRWVQDNIANFQGDPSRVTIFGESAGSISVHMQMLNPGAKGLFSRAIMQSGTALMDLYPEIDQREQAFKIASRLECNINNDGDAGYNSEELLSCLRDIPALSFVMTAMSFVEFGTQLNAFSPRYGEATVPDHPAKLLREGKYNMVDITMGFNQHDGGVSALRLFMVPNALEMIANNFSTVGHNIFYMEKSENDVAAQIMRSYTGEIREYVNEDVDALTEMFGDYLYDMPQDYSIDLHARDSLYGKNVYAYELKYKGGKSFLAISGPEDMGQDYIHHGDDLSFLFKFDPNTFNNTITKPGGRKLEGIMLELWANFATHGNPTPDRSLGFTWAPITLKSTDHLILKPEPYMEADTRCERRKVYTTFNISINQELFPGRVAAGADWKPWRIQDQMQC